VAVADGNVSDAILAFFGCVVFIASATLTIVLLVTGKLPLP
jgi:NifU-like protein involved in Fe-S cluster formation